MATVMGLQTCDSLIKEIHSNVQNLGGTNHE
jgi:hypothetical protein